MPSLPGSTGSPVIALHAGCSTPATAARAFSRSTVRPARTLGDRRRALRSVRRRRCLPPCLGRTRRRGSDARPRSRLCRLPRDAETRQGERVSGVLAAGEGFEPPEPLSRLCGFQDEPLSACIDVRGRVRASLRARARSHSRSQSKPSSRANSSSSVPTGKTIARSSRGSRRASSTSRWIESR